MKFYLRIKNYFTNVCFKSKTIEEKRFSLHELIIVKNKMNIHEHQAKEILREFGAPVSNGAGNSFNK